MGPLVNFVKRNQILFGSISLMGIVHYSWYVMQQDMQTSEVGRTPPWIRVSYLDFVQLVYTLRPTLSAYYHIIVL